MSAPSPNCGRLDLQEQDRQIEAALDALADAVNNPDLGTADVLATYLERLLQIHFAAEESLASQHGLADSDSHTREHAELMSQLRCHVESLQKAGVTNERRLGDFVDQLRSHIRSADQTLDRQLAPTAAASTESRARTM